MNILNLIGRDSEIFNDDIHLKEFDLSNKVNKSSFLVIGGAGSIGQAVTKEIFKRNPVKLHVVDISENNLAELVRDLRSSYGYIDGDFKTFALDIGSIEYDAFIDFDGNYDYVLNLSALKHVRSEKDPFTLMRMIDVNIFNTNKTIFQSIEKGTKKYFCVSTDKAANPVNLMGASKRIMEMVLFKMSNKISISTARFANVAFSDGSLLHSFNQRIQKRQPIVAPTDVKRYFLTPKEAGELCLISCIYGKSGEIFFPKLNEKLHLITFADIAIKYLNALGYEPFFCNSEEQARKSVDTLAEEKKWPCFFTKSDTTGEKDFEEFYTDNEVLDFERFNNFGIITKSQEFSEIDIEFFFSSISELKKKGRWNKKHLVDLFIKIIPNFKYSDKGKYLDSKM